MANTPAVKTYKGGTFRDLLRAYGNDRMKTDRKYKRDVITALKKRRTAKGKTQPSQRQKASATK